MDDQYLPESNQDKALEARIRGHVELHDRIAAGTSVEGSFSGKYFSTYMLTGSELGTILISYADGQTAAHSGEKR